MGDTAYLMAEAYLGLQRLAEAAEHARAAVRARRQAVGAAEGDENWPLRSGLLGRVLLAQGKLGEALSHEQQALAMAERVIGKNHPALIPMLADRGETLRRLGQHSGAVAHVTRALQIAGRADIAESLRGQVSFALARALWDAGDQSAARQQGELAAQHYARSERRERARREVAQWLASHPAGS